jgi:hypothetical protein
LKPNVLRNDPYIPIYAGLTTLAIMGVLTVYKNYTKTTKTESEIELIRNEIIDALHANYKTSLENNKPSELIGPTLIHLCWSSASTYSRHDFLGGVSGATMRFPPEQNYVANRGLDRARAFLQPVKEAHPSVSYSDLWTLAAVVAIEAMGGPVIPWVSGRPDATAADPAVTESRCPVADSGDTDGDIDHIKVLFGRIGGLKYKHIVALFGAHTVGCCHEVREGCPGFACGRHVAFTLSIPLFLSDASVLLNCVVLHTMSRRCRAARVPGRETRPPSPTSTSVCCCRRTGHCRERKR